MARPVPPRTVSRVALEKRTTTQGRSVSAAQGIPTLQTASAWTAQQASSPIATAAGARPVRVAKSQLTGGASASPDGTTAASVSCFASTATSIRSAWTVRTWRLRGSSKTRARCACRARRTACSAMAAGQSPRSNRDMVCRRPASRCGALHWRLIQQRSTMTARSSHDRCFCVPWTVWPVATRPTQPRRVMIPAAFCVLAQV
eukprot:COSAG04_NODE_1496_length_6528_cov_6.474568_4_plen_202_part_00